MLLPHRRILLADDDHEVRLGVADLLSGIGLDVLQAENGLEAIALGRAERIDGALFDVHMPGVSGMEAITILRREVIELPCIVYSGRWSVELEREALELGAAACLKKPVDPDLLRREVRRVLRLTADRN
jgi:DNA-binding response OmpR family regulator